MQWNAEADQAILFLILKHTDVKIPYDKIAEHFGCTPKAVTHRIAFIKKSVAARADGSGVGTSSVDSGEIAAAPKRKRAPAKKPSGGIEKTDKKVKVEKEEELGADGDEEEEEDW